MDTSNNGFILIIPAFLIATLVSIIGILVLIFRKKDTIQKKETTIK